MAQYGPHGRRRGAAAAGVAFIREGDDASRGVRVHHADADYSWALLTEDGGDGLPSKARLIGEQNGAANYLDVTLPEIFRRHDNDQNDWDILVRRGNPARTTAAVAAYAHIESGSHHGGVTFRAVTAGVGGNGFVVTVEFHSQRATSFSYTSATAGTLISNSGDTVQDVIDAVAAARHEGAQIVEVVPWENQADSEVGFLAIGGHTLAHGVDALANERDPLSFAYSPDIGGSLRTEAFLLTCLPADTLDDISTVIESLHYGGSQPFQGLVEATGSTLTDTLAESVIPSQPDDAEEEVGFAGGTATPAPSVSVSETNKRVTISYSDEHLLQDLIEAATDEVAIAAVADTNPYRKPVSPGFVVAFDFDEKGDGSGLASPSTPADGVVDAVSLALTADYTLEAALGRTRGATLEADLDLTPLTELRAMTPLLGNAVTTPRTTTQVGTEFLDDAAEVTFGVDVGAIDEFTVRTIQGAHNYDFRVPVYEWSRLPARAQNNVLVAGTDAYEATDLHGEGHSLLVGRAAGNEVLVQLGSLPFTGSFTLQLHTTRFSGGLLDQRVGNATGRHNVCAQVRSANEPAVPAGIEYDGFVLRTATIGGLEHSQAGGAAPSGDDKLWLLFGQATYTPLTGQWTVDGSWFIVDTTDYTLSAQYASAWTGPWNPRAYIPIIDTFARIRLPNGNFIVRRIGSDAASQEHEWQLLAEVALDNTQSSYSTDLFRHLDAGDFDEYAFEFRWASSERDFARYPGHAITGVNLNQATQVVGNGNVFRCIFRRNYPSGIGRSNIRTDNAGSNNQQAFRLNFVRADNDGSGPFETLSIWDIGMPTRTGTFRLWARH